MGGRTCGTREGASIWCNLDPCGVICACITYCLIAYSQYAVTLCVLAPWMGLSFFGVFHTIAFNALACLAHVSHATAMLSDPGAVSYRAEPPSAEIEAGGGAAPNFCRKCDAYKPVRAHHCSICRRCIVKMDHHCPWVNNCVGIGNHKFFIQFISYVLAISLYSLALVFFRLMTCMSADDGCNSGKTRVVLVLPLVFEAIMFGLFTMCMVCDQWEVVTTNQTHIDRLKGERHTPSVEINEVFGVARTGGRRFWIDCFFPTRLVFPADVWEDVMGYRCRNACGLAAAAVAKAARPGVHSDRGDAGSDGDVELGDFNRGPLGTVRERRQSDSQRLLGREGRNGCGGSDSGAGGLSVSPHRSNRMFSASGTSALLLPSAGDGGGDRGRRDDIGAFDEMPQRL